MNQLDPAGLLAGARRRLDGCSQSLLRSDLTPHEIENEFIAAATAMNQVSKACLARLGDRGERPDSPTAVTAVFVELARRGIELRRDLASDLKWLNHKRNGSIHDGIVEEISYADAQDAAGYVAEYIEAASRLIGS